MTTNKIQIHPINPQRTTDRLKLCWGHLNNWQNLQIVQKSKQWLEKTASTYQPTTLIAYQDNQPIGMIEFLPMRLLEKHGLCPCRTDTENNETPQRYTLGSNYDNYLFISCFLINSDFQGKGIGTTLLNHFLNQALKQSDGAIVYIRERDETWDKHIHWPTGPEQFYTKAGFKKLKALENPKGQILYYKKPAV
jgi:GNAT superfamily N-acetyltransferase